MDAKAQVSKKVININDKTLAFAVTESGYSSDNLIDLLVKRAKKKHSTREYFKKILSGEQKPLLADLKVIDSVLKRGLPFYFLTTPKKESTFAKFRGQISQELSPNFAVNLREYQYIGTLLNEMMINMQVPIKKSEFSAKIDDDASRIASKVREKLNYVHSNFKNADLAFKYLRDKIEKEFNIYIFRDTLAEESNFFGLLLNEGESPPLIIINRSESKKNELFTLMHELAHFVLSDSAEADTLIKLNSDRREEKWCNRFAFSFFVTEEIEKIERFGELPKKVLLDRVYQDSISTKYHVSRLALMIRFAQLNLISQQDIIDFQSQFSYRFSEGKKKVRPKDMKISRVNLILSEYSSGFLKLLKLNYSSGRITRHELSNQLSIRNREGIEKLLVHIK